MKARVSIATASEINSGVKDSTAQDIPTPHNLYMGDDVYTEIYKVEHIEQVITANIEAMFILLLGKSDLIERQDLVSFDKLEEMIINSINCILGVEINARTIIVHTPVEYVAATVKILTKKWYKGKFSFLVLAIEILTWRLTYIVRGFLDVPSTWCLKSSIRWLKFHCQIL